MNSNGLLIIAHIYVHKNIDINKHFMFSPFKDQVIKAEEQERLILSQEDLENARFVCLNSFTLYHFFKFNGKFIGWKINSYQMN